MNQNNKNKASGKSLIHARTALSFLILMAFMSCFNDMVHEGASSIIGAFESFVGASALAISITSGLGMFIGYSLRLLTGWAVDKTKRYWTFTIIGYILDLIMIPLLALVPTNGWGLACTFIILEKVGKAIKKPAKNSLISFAAKENGTGKSFAINELLDQIGAFLGPIILTVTYLIVGEISTYDKYRIGFLVLGIPVVVCLTILLISRFKYPHPEVFEKEKLEEKKKIFNKPFIFLLIGSALMALGFVDFPLFTSHVMSLNIIDNNYLPLIYSFAMLIDAVSSLIFGILYDKKGFITLVIATLISSPFCFFFMYFGQLRSVLIGAGLWGVGIGAQESVMLSAVTDLSSKDKRGKAFSVFDIVFGLFWFVGSILTGWLYTVNSLAMCLVSLLLVVSSGILYVCSAISVKKEHIKTEKLSS